MIPFASMSNKENEVGTLYEMLICDPSFKKYTHSQKFEGKTDKKYYYDAREREYKLTNNQNTRINEYVAGNAVNQEKSIRRGTYLMGLGLN